MNVTLNELTGTEKAHWELHLKAAQRDLPDNKEVPNFLSSRTRLPDIKHPSYIHDWLEYPEMRNEIEALNG